MGAHLIDDEFQSDKYPTTPRGFFPMKLTDKRLQDLVWEAAQRYRAVDAELADDLELALKLAGYQPNGWQAKVFGRELGGGVDLVVAAHFDGCERWEWTVIRRGKRPNEGGVMAHGDADTKEEAIAAAEAAAVNKVH
jgi:hypothetical protein